MAREIKAGVQLSLKDQFSSQIKNAGIAVQGFADKAFGMAEKVNQAFSGVAGTLGTLGISVGALATVKSTIDLDDRMVRLGLTANASAAQVNRLKRQIFETAQMPDIKLNTDSIISGLEVVMTKTGDLQFVQDNVRNIALALQASGEAGESMGAVFAEFAKFGYTMDEILPLMDDLIAQGDQGAFTFGEFAKNAPAVYSAYSAIGTTPEHIRRANAAMQILMAGTKSSEVAVRALNSTMMDLSDPDKQKKLRMLGINVRDLATGEFRDFSDIMFDIAEKADQIGNADFFGTIFGNVSIQAIRAYMTQGERMYDSLVNLGDTTGLLQQKSAMMADTLKSNLQNLQTAFLSFADKNLTGPLQNLTDLLNKLAENPEKIQRAIKGIIGALGALAVIRVGAGIVSFVASLNSLKSGGGVNMSGLANAAGGAGIPVHVTNWGGAAGSSMMPGMGNVIPPIPRTGNAAPGAASLLAKASPYLAFAAATIAFSQIIDKAHIAKYNIDGKHYSEWEDQAERAEILGDRESELEARIAVLNIQIPEYEKLRAGFDPNEMFVHYDATGGSRMVTLNALRAELRALQAEAAGGGDAFARDDDPSAALPPVARGSPGVFRTGTPHHWVNDLIVTPSGQFSTHPDDYIFAMKNPASLVNNEIHNEVRTVQFIPQATPPVVVEGEIELKSELVIDDKGYRLRQQVGKNTTPYKFAVGSAMNARMIQ